MKTGRTAKTVIGTWTTWLTMETERATRLMGVTPVKVASAVVVVRIQPQPVPESSETTSMVASAISPATAVCPMRRRMEASLPGPHPPEEQHAEQRGGLHPRRKRTQDDPGHRTEALGHGQARHQQADHQGVVVGPPDERQQDKGRPHPDQDGMGRVVFQRPGQRRRGGHGQCEPGHLQQTEEDEVRQDLVARGLVEQTVHAEEGGAVGRFRSRPHRVGHLVERTWPRAPRARTSTG